MKDMIEIVYLNNDGGGLPSREKIAEGTTLKSFLAVKIGEDFSKYMIRVNREVVEGDYVLQHEDRCSCTPVKIEGAKN